MALSLWSGWPLLRGFDINVLQFEMTPYFGTPVTLSAVVQPWNPRHTECSGTVSLSCVNVL